MNRLPPTSTLFPYTTLFRSRRSQQPAGLEVPDRHHRAIGHPLARLEEADRPRGDRARRPKGDRVRCATQRGESMMGDMRSEEHTSEPSHMSISYAVFCLKKK